MFGSQRRHHRAFTLIELLVVISIIALLLSILLPTLSNAREQAKLIACGSNMKQIGIGVFAYAADHDGTFPLRMPTAAGNTLESAFRDPGFLKSNNSGSLRAFDHRLALEGYFTSLNGTFLDPLSPGQVDLASTAAAVLRVYSSYDLWYNYAMEVGGDRLEKTDDLYMEWNGRRFNVLAADRGIHYSTWSVSSHTYVNENQYANQRQGADTLSLWYTVIPEPKLKHERNFLYVDGHVAREGNLTEDKFVKVPLGPYFTVTTGWSFLPAMN